MQKVESLVHYEPTFVTEELRYSDCRLFQLVLVTII